PPTLLVRDQQPARTDLVRVDHDPFVILHEPRRPEERQLLVPRVRIRVVLPDARALPRVVDVAHLNVHRDLLDLLAAAERAELPHLLPAHHAPTVILQPVLPQVAPLRTCLPTHDREHRPVPRPPVQRHAHRLPPRLALEHRDPAAV